ncbi:MerR family DNA-binding protein [Dokdonella sp.]|uniref:MerR family DNA-binding protein n=1 Tax=Dokdonella sp. TaxID=2291710 RepID=UPI002F411D72
MNIRHPSSFTIGRLAAAAGVGIDTVRHYEREGLLTAPARSESGYRHYDLASATRLRFIRRARELGFSLDDIRDLLALSADGGHGTQGVRQRAEARLADVERRIAELRRVQRGLRKLVDACPGHGPLDRCPILAALGDKETP